MNSTLKLKILMLGCFALLFGAFVVSNNTPKVASSSKQALPVAAGDDYVGTETCKACHEDQFSSVALTVHGKSDNSRWKDDVQGCESCHGPGKAHVDGGGDKTKITSFKNRSPKENSQTCMGCHSQTSDHATWRGSKHETAGLSCLDCHAVHQSPRRLTNELMLFANVQSETKLLKKRSEADTCYQCHSDVRKSEFQRSTHLFKTEDREARMTCSACHDAHGSVGEKLMKTTSINDTCYTCHTEKRGPFLWEHAPVRENCASCHKAHGSNHLALLKARTPMLCQSCHIQGRHQTVAGKPNSVFMINRSCTNCHSQIHGSNHPSGINLQK
jgi:DmsE family decaheme c-type cytochrome